MFFLTELLGLSPQQEIQFFIDLVLGAQPISKPTCQMGHTKPAELEKPIATQKSKNFIRPSYSTWGTPMLFVKKKDETLQFFVDCQELNKVTIKSKYHLPRIDDWFYQLQRTYVFLKIDLKLDYHQLRVTTENILKITFYYKYGQFEFRVMPLGSTNALVAFIYLMNWVFWLILDQYIIIFLDDILVYSKNPQKRVVHLAKVLETLRQYWLYTKLRKYSF